MLGEELEGLDFSWDELGFDITEVEELEDDTYSDKTESFIYEPSDEIPALEDLADTGKYTALTMSVDYAVKDGEISREEGDFLRLAAARHIVFDYGKIADYYAAASKKMQELMEESALVIIDYDKAIENGYVCKDARRLRDDDG